MARATTEVLTGPGYLYTAASGEAFPSNAPADHSTDPGGNWEDVGYTDDGAAFEFDLTFEDIEVAELAEPIESRWTAAEYRLVAALAQFRLENLQTALNGGTITPVAGPPVQQTYTPPTVGGDTAATLLFAFENEQGFGTNLEVPSYRNVGSASVPFTKAPQKSVLACSFKFQSPSSGNIFTFREYISAT